MKKQKLKKISAKLFLAIFVINAVFIVNFGTPASAVGGDLNVTASSTPIYEGEEVTVKWTAIALPNDGDWSYGAYKSEIWQSKDGGDWESKGEISGLYDRTKNILIEEHGTYIFEVREYAYAKVLYNGGSSYTIIKGCWDVATEQSNEVQVYRVHISPICIYEGESLTITWQAVEELNDETYRYSEYYSELYLKNDDGETEYIGTVEGLGQKSYDYIISKGGYYTIIVKQYALIRFSYPDGQLLEELGPYHVRTYESRVFEVRESLYDLKANPYLLLQGDVTLITWKVNPKEGVEPYESRLLMKFEDDDDWTLIVTKNGIGSQEYVTGPFNQEEIYYLKVDLYIDGVYTTSEGSMVSVAKSLIGSINRAFPALESSRLGYVMQTVEFFNIKPRIYWGISKDIPARIYIQLDFYVDGIFVHTDGGEWTYNLINGFIDLDVLKPPCGHQIEIEISYAFNIDTQEFITDNSAFTLEHLKVGGIDFSENLIYEDGTIHTPAMLHTFGEEANNAHITFNMKPAYGVENGDDGKVLNGNDFSYRSVITIQLDKNTTYYDITPNDGLKFGTCFDYIHSVSMDYKIIDQFGNIYVPPDGIPGYVESSNTAIGHEDKIAYWTMKFLELNLEFASMAPYIGEWIGWINYGLTWIGDPEYNNAWWASEPIEPGYYSSYWEIGHSSWGNSIEPIPKRFTNVTVSTDVIEDTYTETPIGAYQIQVGWSVNIWTCEYESVMGGCDIYHKETISGSYYSNFIYEVI